MLLAKPTREPLLEGQCRYRYLNAPMPEHSHTVRGWQFPFMNHPLRSGITGRLCAHYNMDQIRRIDQATFDEVPIPPRASDQYV
jgi:hypothetical protein